MDESFDWIAAPHTPFSQNGELALEVVGKQAAHLRSVSVTGVLVAGSTGEGASLTSAERQRLIEQWVQVAGGLRVMAHVGHNSVPEAAQLARGAAEAGAHAVCAAPPSWFPLASAEQVARTLAAIAAAAPELPFFYYHIPVLSGVDIKMRDMLPIVRDRIPNFAGVKFTHMDVEDFGACVQEHGGDLRLLWGIDENLIDGLQAGAHGVVGSTYNFAVPIYRRLLAAFRAGDLDQAEALQKQSVLLVDTLGARGYAPSAKMMMKLLGADCGPARLPLQPEPIGGEHELRADLDRIGFFEWVAR